jgi:general nucleoside transport system ATP-binding protein
LSVIFISHKLAEVLRVCHRVAVLRAGQLVATAPASSTTQQQLAQWMVGHAVPALAAIPIATTLDEAAAPSPANGTFTPPNAGTFASPSTTSTTPSVACALRGVSALRTARSQIVNVNLTLHAGEIVAIAGVSGNGQGALADVLCGTLAHSAGHITLRGAAWPAQQAAAQLTQLGVARIPEDRRGVGVVGDLPLWENAVSERLRSRAFAKFGWVKREAAWAHAQRIVQQFDVRGAGLASRTALLSGGNMQKLILGRALLSPAGHASPTLIVAHQPTWGLDIGAVAYVHQQLLAARDAGAAVLVISDDLDEVMALGERIALMHAGTLTEARQASAWTRETLGLAMAGAAQNPVESLTT